MLLSFSNNFKSKKFITSIFLLFNFIIADPTDGCDIDDFSLFLTSDGQVLYNSSQSIAGFQFDVDGGNNTSIGNAYGGDAQQAGFTVSAGNSTVIGFSFTGSTISAGCGTLTNLEISGPFSGLSSIIISDASGVGLDFSYYNGGSDDGGDPCDLIDCATGYICDDGECICNAEEDCFGECGGNGVVDDCGVCGGDGSSCSDDGGDFNGFTLSVVDNDTYFDSDSEAAVVITLENEDDVAGFQFVLWDDPDVLSYVDIYGTDRTEGFTISASEGEAGVTLLGFSFSGATIAPGHGPILVIQYNTGSVLTDTIVDLNISASILSDPDGIAINHESENNILFLSGSDPILGCTDQNACNFDIEANTNDGSCEYPEENYNCSGDCIVDIDCAGDCGGNLEYDECGVCDGNNDSCTGCMDSLALNFNEDATISCNDCCDYEDFNGIIVINEINYNPALSYNQSDADYEFIELYNNSNFNVNLNSWNLVATNIDFTFDQFTLGANDYIVLARNSETYAGSISHEGTSLLNGGDSIVLSNSNGDIVDNVLYADDESWPQEADASGSTLELINPNLDNSIAQNWQASYVVPGGTPGYQNSIAPDPIPGCMDENACNFNADATIDNDSCEYPEENFNCNGDCIADIDCSGTCGGVLEYDDCGVCDGDGPSFECWNGSFACNTSDCPEEPVSEVIEILYDSDADIYGFQFSVSGVDIINAGSGSSAESGFTVSNSGTTVIGFSLQGNYVEAGSGVLVLIEVEGIVSDACLDNVIVSGQGGEALSITVENCFTISYQLNEDIFGCTNQYACNYNPDATVDNDSCEYPEENYDCDGNCLLDVDCTGDCGGQAQEDECGICNGDNSSCTGCLDEEALNYNSDALIGCDDCCLYNEFNNYIVDLTDTGESSLVIIQSAEGLDIGDEIGLFDVGGIIESCDPSFGCEDIMMGEVLVGSGIWTGEQLEIVAIGSVDLSQFGGPTLNGYVSGNDIKIKVWKNSTQTEYDTNVLYQVGDGIWGQILTVISNLEPIFTIIQSIELNPYQINMVSLNVSPNNNNLASITSDLDVLLVSNDQSDFYVPDYNVNQIDVWGDIEGLSIVLNGTNSQTLLVEGVPIETNTVIELEPFRMNLLPYLLQECISTTDAFAGVEDNLLVVKNDDSEYYVPAFGVQTLTEMCPGESYGVFLHGSEGLEFIYPTGVMSSNHSNHFVEDYKSRTRTNDVDLTGESHLVLLSEISGEVSVGDQLRAYANNQLVGSINIVEEHLNGTHPVDLVAVGSVDLTEFAGPILDGYIPGDMIELRLWSVNKSVELKVSADLSDMQYGNAMELSTGVASVLNEGTIVTSLSLTQNYPNPFNPSTTISYNVDASGMVTLKVYDVMGRLVRTLVDGHKISGYESGYSVVWDGKDQQGQQVSAGLYIYSLQTPTGIKTKKMVLMK